MTYSYHAGGFWRLKLNMEEKHSSGSLIMARAGEKLIYEMCCILPSMLSV